MNKVELVGRIVQDIKVLTFDNNKQMARFSIAINDKGNDKPQFFSVVAWEKLAELINKYCKKGDRIGVCGQLKQNDYTSTNGEKWHAVEIVAHEIEFLSSSNKDGQPKDKDLKPIDDDNLPF